MVERLPSQRLMWRRSNLNHTEEVGEGVKTMAYLRWANSDWYIFWSTSSDDASKEGQNLAVWHCSLSGNQEHSYTRIKSFLEDIIPDWSTITSAPLDAKDKEEALSAMRRWVEEVEGMYDT